jgi:hypothetical protein
LCRGGDESIESARRGAGEENPAEEFRSKKEIEDAIPEAI